MTDRKSEIAARILQGEAVELAIYAAALGAMARKKPSPEIAAAAALDLTESALSALEARRSDPLTHNRLPPRRFASDAKDWSAA